MSEYPTHRPERAGRLSRLARWFSDSALRRDHEAIEAQRIADIKSRWQRACELSGLARLVFTPNGPMFVPRIGQVQLGPPTTFTVQPQPGQLLSDFETAAQRIAAEMGVANVRIRPLAAEWIVIELMERAPTADWRVSDRALYAGEGYGVGYLTSATVTTAGLVLTIIFLQQYNTLGGSATTPLYAAGSTGILLLLVSALSWRAKRAGLRRRIDYLDDDIWTSLRDYESGQGSTEPTLEFQEPYPPVQVPSSRTPRRAVGVGIGGFVIAVSQPMYFISGGILLPPSYMYACAALGSAGIISILLGILVSADRTLRLNVIRTFIARVADFIAGYPKISSSVARSLTYQRDELLASGDVAEAEVLSSTLRRALQYARESPQITGEHQSTRELGQSYSREPEKVSLERRELA